MKKSKTGLSTLEQDFGDLSVFDDTIPPKIPTPDYPKNPTPKPRKVRFQLDENSDQKCEILSPKISDSDKEALSIATRGHFNYYSL